MARIRSIKPEFFTSLSIASLDLPTRLTFIGLWTHCDDEGRCVDEARLIKAALWPLDDRTAADIEKDLGALSESSLIARYEVGGRRYLAVCGWDEHQRINRPTKSKLPAPEEADSAPVKLALACTDERSEGVRVRLTEDSLSAHRGKGKEQGTGNMSNPPTPPRGKRGLRPADDDPAFAAFWDAYPRKVDKGHARNAWAKAIAAGVDSALIIKGVEQYRDDPTRSRDPKFIPHPTTWLNGERWADQPADRETHIRTWDSYEERTPGEFN
ncbi:hypothetical protein FHR32_005091 [Streptosporangium album]|uniref:Uncharacterized protein n=1 Tax=Streptosporangium album TaxID=47479 RepID=A0A7W7RYQ7_9ACTN|nr:hypothetical protein [Streptosporangium album]MBB4940714.1 hypothetical protein [Streptosporangium album]